MYRVEKNTRNMRGEEISYSQKEFDPLEREEIDFSRVNNFFFSLQRERLQPAAQHGAPFRPSYFIYTLQFSIPD